MKKQPASFLQSCSNGFDCRKSLSNRFLQSCSNGFDCRKMHLVSLLQTETKQRKCSSNIKRAMQLIYYMVLIAFSYSSSSSAQQILIPIFLSGDSSFSFNVNWSLVILL